MGEIKAIETFYKGYKFRSRLEARWAVFFDAAGIEYEYEPEGYTLSDGSRYLPDFYLPKFRIYVEVKPRGAFSIEYEDNYVCWPPEAGKYGLFAHDIAKDGFGAWFVFGDPIDAFASKEHGGGGENHLFCKCTCAAKYFSEDGNDICVCGQKQKKISECKEEVGLVSGPVIAFSREWLIWNVNKGFMPTKVPAFPYEGAREVLEGNGMSDELIGAATNTLNAAKIARQARFEHGETPKA